jgi:hypothetical protein
MILKWGEFIVISLVSERVREIAFAKATAMKRISFAKASVIKG